MLSWGRDGKWVFNSEWLPQRSLRKQISGIFFTVVSVIFVVQELAGKNAEMIEEVSRVRIDLNAKVERLENDRRSKEDLYSRIASLEKELSGQ